jgi:hypothetical protein
MGLTIPLFQQPSLATQMERTPTVFEAAMKTICTTNVAWRATVRMVHVLVEQLGEAAPTGAHAFPTAEAMALDPRPSIGRPSAPCTGALTSTRSRRASLRRKASDATVERRFRRYGRYSGLAFWLYLTKDWVSG